MVQQLKVFIKFHLDPPVTASEVVSHRDLDAILDDK